MAVRLRDFLGEIPKLDNAAIGDLNAQQAVNVRLSSGRLDTLYYPKSVVASVVAGALSMFRMFDTAGTDYWLTWNSDVNVARAPIAGDSSFKILFTSDSFEPRITNKALATSAPPYPTAWYVLGVTPPTTAPTVTPSGGSSTNETRAYVYTFVTQWGEESAPSPASSLATGHPDGTWTISGMQAAPTNTYTITAASWSGGVLTLTCADTFGLRAGEYVTLAGFAPTALNASFKVASVGAPGFTVALAADPGTITDGVGTAARNAPHNTTNMVKRIYRSVTSGTNPAYYLVVDNLPVATTSTTDSAGTNIGEPIPTTTWAMPPADMQMVKMLPVGAAVGFSGNQVCFSEPGAVYAYPVDYRVTCDSPIVGIGVYGSAVVAMTQGTPYLIQGTDPSTMSATKIDEPWPCIAKKSICEFADGVSWACPQGQALYGAGGPVLLTQSFYTMKEWAELAPSTFVAAYHDNRYYAGYTVSSEIAGMLIFDRQESPSVSRSDMKITGIYNDAATGKLYVLRNGDIQEWDTDESARLPVTWWSKEFVLPVPSNLGAAKIDADFTSSAAEAAALAAMQAAQQALNTGYVTGRSAKGSWLGKGLNSFSWNGSRIKRLTQVGDAGVRRVIFELYADGELIFSTTRTSDKAFRLPSGRKYDRVSVRVVSTVPISGILFGETMDSLRQV